MFSKKEELSKLIDKKIKLLEQEKVEYQNFNKDLLELYSDLEKDINKLVYLKKDDLKDIIYMLEIEDKDRLYKEILTIKKILTMNKDYKATLRLFKKDKDSYNYFLENFKKLNDKLNTDDPNILKIAENQNEFKILKERVNKENFYLNTKDLTLLEDLAKLDKSSTTQEIFIELIDYDNCKFQERLANSKKKEKKEINTKDLKDIFKVHKYNYTILDDKYKNYLIKEGRLKRIKEVFETLEKYDFPIIEDQYVLTSLLLGSDSSTINQVCNFSLENKLIPRSLLDISGALITQNDNDSYDDYSIMTKGSSIDFMRNIQILKQAGISINYIFQACKSILTMPSTLLEKNLDWFNKYGFSFEYKRRGVIDPSPSALLSQNFASVVDAFIEIHPKGLKYLNDNLSNVKTVSNPDALMFYNIYESEKRAKGIIEDPEDGPFRKVMEDDHENFQLKSIITRNRPDYRNTYYMGITENNKKQKTNTLDINIPGKKRFDKIIMQNVTQINNSIFNNPYIQSLDKYIDDNSPLIYNFKGVRISRLKVLRIYNTLIKNGIKDSLNSIMYAITYNTIINLENYTKIYEIVRRRVENR